MEVALTGQQLDAGEVADQAILLSTSHDALRAFDALFSSTAQELTSLIGERGASAVLQRALSLARRHERYLDAVDVRSPGLSLEKLRGSPEALAASSNSLRELYVVFADVACSLIGPDLVSSVLARVQHSMERR